MNDPNMANPEMRAVTLVKSTGRSESTRMSISGSSTWSSSTTQATAPTTESANSPSAAGDVHPQLAPWDSASKNVIEDDRHQRPRPGTSMREVERTGDSGMNRRTSTIATATPAAPTTKSQRQLALSTISPEMYEPEPSADPEHGREQPDPDLHPLGRELVADDAEAEREHGAAAPDTMRNRIRVQMSGAAAQPMQPTRNATSDRTSSRSLPYRSPSLPRIGVSTAADSRKPVMTQVTHVVDAPSSRWSSGSAGMTIVCWSAYAAAAMVRIPRVRP